MFNTANLILAALFIACVLPTATQAQDRDPAAVPLNVTAPKKPHPFTAGFRETFYLGDAGTLLGEKHYEEVTLRVRGNGNSDFISAGIDIGASYGINIPDYLSIYAPEGYFRFMLGDEPRANSPLITFGRKKDRWSLLDSFWELGTWQPQYRWDYLRPEEQGLVGAFFELPGDNIRLVLFASPLFVPDSGASYRLRNGAIVSDNPWFFEPNDQIIVNQETGSPTRVQYTPNIPPVEEIIRKGSFGGTVELGARSAGFWARSSYVYKPRNQISLPFTGSLSISSTDTFVDVQLYPKVQFHHLAALDFGYKTEKFSMWVANLYDKPISEEFPNLNYQILFPTYFVSPGLEYSDSIGASTTVGVVASYLAKAGENPIEVGDDTSASNPVFGIPYNFTNALRTALRLSFPVKANLRSSWSIAYTYNLDDKAAWIKFVSDWALNEKFRASLEADLIGSPALRSDPHFLSRYRGNDRVIATASMVF